MAIEPNGPAPYAPADAVVRVVEHHRNLGLRPPVNTEVISRVIDSDAVAPRVMKALRLYDLVDGEGELAPQFEELRRVTSDDEFRERFAEILRAAYADIFQYVDPATVDAERLEGQFRRYEPVGQRDRMAMLFRGLCEYAGIMPKSGESGNGQSRPARRRTPRQEGKPKPSGGKPSGTSKPKPPPPPPPPPPADDAKARYLDVLLKLVEKQDTPDAELLDRIERVIDMPNEASSPGTSEGGDGDS